MAETMLRNDPPPKTRVRFLRKVGNVPVGAIGHLYERGRHETDRAGDKFTIEYRGERMTVRRDEIRRYEENE